MRAFRGFLVHRRLLVCAALLLALVPTASAANGNGNGVSRRTASHDALHALKATRHPGAELVLGLLRPLPAGTVVSIAGPERPSTSRRITRSPDRVISVLRAPAWLFYQDLAPFQQYAHPGRVALVDAADGHVSVSGTLAWPPLVNGALPAFLGSAGAYDGTRYRVLYRPYVGHPAGSAKDAAATAARAAQLAREDVRAALDPSNAAVVGGLLAAQHACTVRFSDTVTGGYYAFAQIAQSRAALDYRFSQLSRPAPAFKSSIYSPSSGLSPTGWVSRMIGAQGCKDVLLYLAGGGYAPQNAVNIGMGAAGGDVLHQDVTIGQLRSLLSSHHGVTFEVVIDAAHASGFQSLSDLANVLLVATPAVPFTYLADAIENGALATNDVNPLHLLQLTDRLAFGIDQVVNNSAEVGHIQSLAQSGNLRSVLAYLVGRGFALGGPVDFVTNSGVGSPPIVTSRVPLGGPSGPPQGGPGGPPQGAPSTPPQLSGIESSALQYTAGTPAAPVTGSLTISSPDVPTLTGATVSITSGLVSGEDALGFANQNGITGSYNAATGLLTLTGTASVANYQLALRSVTYSDANGTNPTTGARTITFEVGDAASSNNVSNPVSRSVQVNPNPPPVANDDSASTDKNTAIDLPVLANDIDSDGDAIHVASVNTTGTKGSVSINPDGTVHYSPGGQFAGLQQGQTATDTFTYQASDGFHNSNSATVTVTITGVNDPPVLSNIETSTIQYDAGTAPVQVTNALTITNPHGPTLAGATVAITNGLASGEDALDFSAGNGITGSYNPSTGVLALTGTSSVANYQAALRSVTYNDTNGTTPTTGARTVALEVDDGASSNNLSNVVSRQVQVNPNPPPVANDDSASTNKNTAINIPVLANDTDSDGDTLSVASVDTTGTKGAVSINPDGTIHYNPNGQFASLQQGQTATDTFTYQASDGFHNSNSATVTVTINGVNDPPVLSNIETSTLQYTAGTPAVPVTNALTISNPHGPTLAGGTVAITSGFVSGEDALAFVNQNGITGSYNSATGVLTLTGTSSVAKYQAALQSVTYSDPNGTNPTTGPRTVSFQVDDGAAPNNLSNVVSRQVQVNPNPPPVANDDSASTNKNTPVDINVLANDTDSDGDAIHVDPASINTTGTKGSVSLNPDGTIHYNPGGQFASLQQGQTATDTFTYQASDGFHDSNSATVTVTINGVNDPPVLSNIETSTIQYDAGTAPVQVTNALTITNPHGPTLAGATVAITNGLASGEDALDFSAGNGITGSYNPSTGVLALSGTASVAAYQAALRSVTYSDTNGTSPTTGPRTVAFEVDDGASSNNLSNVVARSVQVNPNPPPTAGNVSASTDKNTAIDINVLASASDPDGDTLSVASVDTTGTKGAVSINPDRTIHYNPNGQFTSLQQGQTATDSFTYQATDGFHNSNSATVTVTITGVNDRPVLSNIETTPATYRAQDPPIQVTNALTISDDDDSTISGATVSIGSGFSAGNDTLSFTNTPNITGSYNSSTGVLTLSGNDTVANYQAALRSVEFSSTDGSTNPAARTVSFAVTDSVGATSLPASRNITVSEANQPPVANNVSYDAVGNTPLGVGTSPAAPALMINDNLLNHASDPDSGAPVDITANTQPANGSVSVNDATGTFTYTPNVGFSGSDSFTYTVTDTDDPANPKSATGTVMITVGQVVWYVDNTKGAGNGTSTSPFNTLAAANAVAGANSIVFLYQGSGDYTGGITLHSGEDLFGQPNGLTVNGDSLVPAGGSTPTITNASGDGIDLANNADVEGVNVSSPSGSGIAASAVNNATVGSSTPVSISGAGGDGIHVTGGNGTLDLAGANVSGSTGHSVLVTGRTGGTATFGGTISDTTTGISLTSNTGSTTDFAGKITASTGTNPAFTATGGGTVNAIGTGSTLTTTTAIALNVSSTAIGSSGLTFQSVSSNGAANGISLANTGSAGGLRVTGSGTTAGSGGTIQRSTGAGVLLSSTSSTSLTDMVISNNKEGVNGTGVSGFTLAGSTLSANGASTTDDGLDFTALTGTSSITNSVVTGSANDDASITDTSGSLNLTVSGSTFSSTASTASVGDGLDVFANGTTSATVSVTGSTFTNNALSHFRFVTAAGSTGSNTVTFSNNTLTQIPANGGDAEIVSNGGDSTTATLANNNIQNAGYSPILLDKESGSTGTMAATVSGNTIGTPGSTCSGSSQGSDVEAIARGSGTQTLSITSNHLYQYTNPAGIDVLDDEGSATQNATVTGNTIADPGLPNVKCPDGDFSGGALWGFFAQDGATGTDTGSMCLALSSNSLTGSAPSAANGGISDIEVDQGQFGGLSTSNTTIRLPGYTGGGTDTNAIQTFMQNNNGGTPSVTATVQGGQFAGGSSCPTP